MRTRIVPSASALHLLAVASTLVLAGIGWSPRANATGSLLDTATLSLTFPDASGQTPMAAAADGTYLYTVSGGSNGGQRFARYSSTGTFDIGAQPGIDFRSIFADNGGALFGKEYCGQIYGLTSAGVATPLFELSDPDCQSSASLNGDDTELYAMTGGVVYRFSSSTGAPPARTQKDVCSSQTLQRDVSSGSNQAARNTELRWSATSPSRRSPVQLSDFRLLLSQTPRTRIPCLARGVPAEPLRSCARPGGRH